VIPTRGRPRILDETLARLAAHAGAAPIEVLVVHDGADPRTREAAERKRPADWTVRTFAVEGAGPARRRNRAIAESRAPVCLFIGDDTFPRPGLIDGHLDFHARHPDQAHALLGLVVPAPPLDGYPFVRWLHEHGAQFNYAALLPHEEVRPESFWTANVSVKRDMLRAAGGFDEGFTSAAGEDTELAFRLARAGMRLRYEPGPVAEHFHPSDLRRTLERMHGIGIAFRRLCERAPEMTPPSRPSARHRVKATALTVALAGFRSEATRRTTWQFLCDEVLRESYWGERLDGGMPRVGRTLARLALADPVANPPLPEFPGPTTG
jgi:GT2 family glycosyltransferase